MQVADKTAPEERPRSRPAEAPLKKAALRKATSAETPLKGRPRSIGSTAPAIMPDAAGGLPPQTRRQDVPARPKPLRSPRPRRIPPILFEGDEAPAPPVSGPGHRFALGPTPPAPPATVGADTAELPLTHETRRLWLAARDPHWLYANWDLSPEEMEAFEARAVAGHLTLRVHEGAVGATPLFEIPLAKGARSWFVHVGRGAVPYIAELGCGESGAGWQTILTSEVAMTPPDMPAAGTEVEFATIPVDVPFAVILGKVAEVARREEPLARMLNTLREQGFAELPSSSAVQAPVWTPAQERALAEVLRVDATRRVWVSSLDVTEAVGRELGGAAFERAAGEQPSPSSPTAGFGEGALGGVSSPAGAPEGGERRRGFWFNVNAELVVYGATEPDARVTIAGRPVKLRPDGSFSLRFALPDGDYELPVVARARTGEEGRSAELQFRRHTHYQGEVGAHPQDARLQPPRAEAITDEVGGARV